jgi:hypothetical protein
MSISRGNAASLALYLALVHPGVFDAYVRTLPGARAAFTQLGRFGDDDDLSDSDDLSDDTDDTEDTSDVDDSAGGDGSLTLDDQNAAQQLRLINLDSDDDATSTPVPGSAADTGIVGPVPGSSADFTTSLASSGPDLDMMDTEEDTADSELATPSADIATITPVVQSISASKTIGGIGAPAVGAATSALTSTNGLAQLATVATQYLNNQAIAGEEQTALAAQAADITAAAQMAALDHPVTGVAYVTGPNGEQEAVMASSTTGQPLLSATGQYIPAATGAGILSTLASSSSLGVIAVIGGIGLLALLLLGHHSGAPEPTYSQSPRRGR